MVVLGHGHDFLGEKDEGGFAVRLVRARLPARSGFLIRSGPGADNEFDSLWNVALTDAGAAPRARLAYALASNVPVGVTIEEVTDMDAPMGIHAATKLVWAVALEPPGRDASRPWMGAHSAAAQDRAS